MDRGLFVALSGAVIQEKRLEVLTNNLANINTAGFKKENPVFEESLPLPYGVRYFSRTNSIVTDMTPGLAEKTERPLDLALNGSGFFTIETPYGTRYTRDGNFTLGPGGKLITKEGYAVLGEKGPIKLTSSNVSIDPQGNIKEQGATVDKLQLAAFSDPSKLVRERNFFYQPAQKLKGIISANTQVEQGSIEISNVNPVKAMTTMIEALRSYEQHTKMIQTLDDMTNKAINVIGNVS